MCGKLAVYLRMCGHDAAYALDYDLEADDRLLDFARKEGRTLITRDRHLADRTDDALLLRSTDVVEQLRELRNAGVRLTLETEPAHCGACNGHLDRVPPETATPEYAPDPGDQAMWRCRACGQLFWKGSHWTKVEDTLTGL